MNLNSTLCTKIQNFVRFSIEQKYTDCESKPSVLDEFNLGHVTLSLEINIPPRFAEHTHPPFTDIVCPRIVEWAVRGCLKPET